MAGCVDQLDLPNVAIVEALLREAQMTECRYGQIERDEFERNRTNDKNTAMGRSLDEVEYFQGTEKMVSEHMIAPQLIEWIAVQGEMRQ